MKKKGLIISTVVMVVVLIASLTTATYAWFTTTSITTVSGFNLTVAASTSVNIGLKANNTYEANASADSFVSGDCHYTGTAGQLGGTWTGETPTMSPTVTHNIAWGQVTKAVGFAEGTTVDAATFANTKTLEDYKNANLTATGTTHVSIAANLEAGTKFNEKVLATANGDLTAEGGAIQGDFAYLFLGVSPSKELAAGSNKVYVIVQASGNGSTLGLAAAMHVAYRLNGATTWTDIDVFDTLHYNTPRANATATVLYDASGIDGLAVKPTYNGTTQSTIQNAKVVPIDLPSTAMNAIDQLELVIYLAGSDSDCIDAAKGVTVNVAIYFSAQAKAEG